MPNLVTHTLFCEDVLEALNNPLFNARRKLFITGGQGPDYLFFHNAPPLAKSLVPSPIRKYGSLLHHENVNGFYASALASIRKTKNRAIRDDMIAYVCGHLCHWALDSCVHPLVYSRTGNCKGRSAWAHHRYESLLDAAMLQYKKNMSIAQYDPGTECFSTDKASARAIARIYIPAIETLYGDTTPPSAYYEALQDWKTLQRYFRDPHDSKKAFFRPLEKLTGLENLVTGFSIPAVCEDNVDICNLLHTPWPHPVTGEIHTESVFDLYCTALETAVEAVTLFLKAIRAEKDEAALLAFLAGRDYDTGMAGQPEPVFFEIRDLTD